LAIVIEPDEGLLGKPRNGALDAAAARVGGVAQAPPVALAPQLEQSGREQRQSAGPALDVAQQRLDELGFDDQSDALRRALDRAAELVARHRPDEHVICAEQLREPRIGGAAAIEVRADGEDDDRPGAGGTDERVGELGALRVVPAGCEDLLELVDRQDAAPLAREPAGRAAELQQRLLPGPDDCLGPVLAAGHHAPGEGWQQPGSHDRRLAAAGRADDREHRRADEACDQLGDEPFAPEEVLGVVGVERREALVRADDRH
jgi:hypothetical protein